MPTGTYARSEFISTPPRLPLEGRIDLTYRCNNNCRHCWLWVPDTRAEAARELTFDEIKNIVDEARSFGCRNWSISGGEPMLREDFTEIFELLTGKCISYSLNTNGALITPAIARLMKRKGHKMVALYGANADIHDHITRTPGSFAATMRGCAYLKEAGAGFMVQIIPMKDNFHQFHSMMALADSLSPSKRIGAAWLYLSAEGNHGRNQEILSQRLSPRQVLELDPPDVTYGELMEENAEEACCPSDSGDRLFASCITARRDFHIDPYGRMSFCSFVKEPSMRYDVRKGTFGEGWEVFIPSLADTVRGGEEYLANCGACSLKKDCRWCAVYSYLEHRRFDKKVDYLCHIAQEAQQFKEEWKKLHRRFFEIAGITLQVDSDLPIDESTFDGAIKHFEVKTPGPDLIRVKHHFSIPDIKEADLGREVYRMIPWAIYRKEDSWIYLIGPSFDESEIRQMAIINKDHSLVRIFNRDDVIFKMGSHNSLCLFPTDQILVARVLADRKAFYLHSAGLTWDGQGLLFVGHSEAGKSTTCNMLRGKAEILCDDRIILRKWDATWKIHGTWSHGDVPDVSPASAPLRAIMFLEKADENRLIPIQDGKEVIKRLLVCVIKSYADTAWWEKTLSLVEDVGISIPCYRLQFNKNGGVVDVIEASIFNSN